MAYLSQKNGKVLKLVVEEFLGSAQAVGSQHLTEKYGLLLSPASIRTLMSELEQQGFLTHLHTSAGRMPTEKGIRYWLENFFDAEKLNPRDEEKLKELSLDSRENVKSAAKTIQKLSDLAVIVGFDRRDVYYTGLASLFGQPEFSRRNLLLGISGIIDELDERAFSLYGICDSENPKVFIGKENPLGSLCGLVAKKIKSRGNILMGILGPVRMNYGRSYSLLKMVK